ncbi:MAG: sulfotransferase [Deltaproteobacteria bacterium]|nr:sulfotransferase [Deltaproteobacteria bacterium]
MKESYKNPNFLIVGASKSGTTSLWHYLKQHPEVFMSVPKEPLFFVSSYYQSLNPKDPKFKVLKNDLKTSPDEYLDLFSGVKNEKAIGEASVPYLYHYDLAIPAIKKHIGDCKIIIVLRNPVQRAFSAYTFLLRDLEESRSFESCLELEENRKKNNWAMIHFYKGAGIFYPQVRAYLEHFKEVKIYLFEELKNHTREIVKDIYAFLGVDTTFVPDVNTKHNISGVPKNMLIHKVITEPNALKNFLRPGIRWLIPETKRRRWIEGLREKNLVKPEMKPETRQELINYFHDDILMLQDLIKRDLTHWLK